MLLLVLLLLFAVAMGDALLYTDDWRCFERMVRKRQGKTGERAASYRMSDGSQGVYCPLLRLVSPSKKAGSVHEHGNERGSLNRRIRPKRRTRHLGDAVTMER